MPISGSHGTVEGVKRVNPGQVSNPFGGTRSVESTAIAQPSSIVFLVYDLYILSPISYILLGTLAALREPFASKFPLSPALGIVIME